MFSQFFKMAEMSMPSARAGPVNSRAQALYFKLLVVPAFFFWRHPQFRSSILLGAAPRADVFDIPIFLRKVLPLQAVDDVVRAYIEAHIGPIIEVIV